MTNTTPPCNLSLLPDAALLEIVQHVPLREVISTLPLVSKRFRGLLRLPDPRWQDTCSYLKGYEVIDGAAFCEWLQPRVARLDSFTCPVDTLRFRGGESFTPKLLRVLPDGLTKLHLQSLPSDAIAQGFRGVGPGYCPSDQDTVPHLDALSRLSSLRELSLPFHTGLGDSDWGSLAALTSLRCLRLTWRDTLGSAISPLGPGPFQMTSLTSLSLAGSKVNHVTGTAALPHLQRLSVSDSASLSLTGASHSTSLTSLSIVHVQLVDSAPALLSILQSLGSLKSLHMGGSAVADKISPLELASLLELSSLQGLKLPNCQNIIFERDPLPADICRGLTGLSMDVHGPCYHLESNLAFLTQLRTLRLWPVHGDFVLPSTLSMLSCLKCLTVMRSYTGDHSQMPTKLDITALGMCGPCIEDVIIWGSFRLTATGSMTQLAARSALRSLELYSGQTTNAEGDTWLHCAALLHALANRASRGLSPVSVSPDLSNY